MGKAWQLCKNRRFFLLLSYWLVFEKCNSENKEMLLISSLPPLLLGH